jgi:hypothetical protein
MHLHTRVSDCQHITATNPGAIARTGCRADREHGKQPGDPTKAAEAILAALDSDEPPLRLALGADAVEGLRAKHASLEEELSVGRISRERPRLMPDPRPVAIVLAGSH